MTIFCSYEDHKLFICENGSSPILPLPAISSTDFLILHTAPRVLIHDPTPKWLDYELNNHFTASNIWRFSPLSAGRAFKAWGDITSQVIPWTVAPLKRVEELLVSLGSFRDTFPLSFLTVNIVKHLDPHYQAREYWCGRWKCFPENPRPGGIVIQTIVLH